MGRLIDLTGKIFGRLTVLGRDTSRYDGRNVFWWCKCICGKTVSVRGQDLRSGNSKSCGCLNQEITSARNTNNLIGKKFSRLTVLRRADINGDGGKAKWICQCDCGNIVEVTGDHLVSGHTQSCGCLQKELASIANTKWASIDEHRISEIFRGMKQRCCNPKDDDYPNYGGRGIYICDEWLSDREKFVRWSLENGYAPTLEIDRKNNDGPYAPWNCRWTTKPVQNNNKSSNRRIEIDGVTHTLAEWANLTEINYDHLQYLLNFDFQRMMNEILDSDYMKNL